MRSSQYGPIIFLCKLFTHFPSYFIFSKQIHLIQRHTDIFFVLRTCDLNINSRIASLLIARTLFSVRRVPESLMLGKHAYLGYCYDWSWWSWWSRWSHNTVPILSRFTLFQKHYRWKTHLLSTTFHIGFSGRMKSTHSHLRSWVTLLPFWTLHVIKKMGISDKRKHCENVLSLASKKAQQ